ncbi:MAG: tRNA-dihydrouridine synthase family protein [Planctomycetota bacterium]
MLEALPEAMLAPLTKGGNLPFRRLCVEFGAQMTLSEMAYARQVVRGSRPEMTLLRKHPSERRFGVQIAAGREEDAVAAAKIAVEHGADFIDLNCGCPIHDVVRRGMGATLLQRPRALARIVAAMVQALTVPVTVKIRSGWSESDINAEEIGQLCEEAGASMLTIHPRTREQRYTKEADWTLVAKLVEQRGIPVVGSGDVSTWHELVARKASSGCASVMLGRAALVKPWLFREVIEQRTWLPSAIERLGVLRHFVDLCREHFGADDRGRKKSMFFLPWHLGFFCRWRPLPDAEFMERAREYPLMQSRIELPVPEDPLERVLRDPREAVHRSIAGILWDAPDDLAAGEQLVALAQRVGDWSEDAVGEVATAHG